MKKLVLVLALTVILAVGAFADHPSGWGIGVVGQSDFAWDGFAGHPGAALSLKAPQLPIFWGINARIWSDVLGLNVTGDYYLIDKTLVPDVNFGWYFGLGGQVGFYHVGSGYNWVEVGARAPIGIYIIPLSFLEVFLDVAPSLGLGVNFGNRTGLEFPLGGIGADVGIRFWF